VQRPDALPGPQRGASHVPDSQANGRCVLSIAGAVNAGIRDARPRTGEQAGGTAGRQAHSNVVIEGQVHG
jgi:hypothetical protein